MAEDKGPDLTLIEADVRNVAAMQELVEELRKLNEKMDRLLRLYGEVTVQLDRIPVMERWVSQIGLGLGVRL